MKKKTFFTGIFVLIALFILALVVCNNSTTTTPSVTPTAPTAPTTPTTPTTPITVPPIEIGPTSFKSVVSDSNFRIKNGGNRNWLISPSFNKAGLRSAGYTKFVFTLNFDAKNEYFLVNAGSRIYASFWEGHVNNTASTGLRYAEKFWTPALSRWEAKEFIHEVSLDNFDNKLTIIWHTSPHGDFSVGTRSITIEAKK